MGPFSKKPSESQVNQQDTTRVDPAHETLPSASTQPVVHKEKHSKAFSFVSVLFLLTLLGAGIMTYLWYNQSADVDSLNQELSQTKSEQVALQKQVADLKKAGTSELATETVTKSEDDMIKEAVVAYNHAFVAAEKTKYTVNVTKKEGVFARASYGTVPPETGAKCLLKEVDNLWLVLTCSQNEPNQADLDKWGVPKNF